MSPSQGTLERTGAPAGQGQAPAPSGRRRLIHLIGALVAGGAESSATDLVLEMKREGLPVELAAISCRQDEAGRAWEAELREAGVPVHVGPSERMRLPTILWLTRLLRAPDVRIAHIHLDYVEMGYYLSRFLHRRRYGVLRKIHNTRVPGGFRGFVARHSDIPLYYSCGEAAHEAFKGHVGGEQILIPNGLAFPHPPHDVEHRDERVRALGLDPTRTHYVHAGRHSGERMETSQKAQDVLIRAWRRFKLGELGGVLHIMGAGSLRPQHEALAEGDPSIVFEGVVPDVQAWLSACDVFVLPSRWEGLPLTGVEAVASGIPCILSDIGPNRELGCEVATYVAVDDEEGLGRALAARVGSREAATPDAVARQRERWGVRRAMRSFLEVYDRLAPPEGA